MDERKQNAEKEARKKKKSNEESNQEKLHTQIPRFFLILLHIQKQKEKHKIKAYHSLRTLLIHTAGTEVSLLNVRMREFRVKRMHTP